ncbi:hypothetical protein E4U35_005956 [Claviceps purpurea]|nr:hypothetical protein E4U35_005956 [Claviceps purpurea]
MPPRKRSSTSREANTQLEYDWLCWADVVQIPPMVPTGGKDDAEIWKNSQYQYSWKIPEVSLCTMK